MDGDLTTGNADSPGRDLYFDLGGSYTVRHVRLYGSSTAYLWYVFVLENPEGCPGGAEILRDWSVGGASQWYPGTATTIETGQVIRIWLANANNPDANAIMEFQFTDVASPSEGDWRTPVSTVPNCTSIFGWCKQ
jgi:hypothetical protein